MQHAYPNAKSYSYSYHSVVDVTANPYRLTLPSKLRRGSTTESCPLTVCINQSDSTWSSLGW